MYAQLQIVRYLLVALFLCPYRLFFLKLVSKDHYLKIKITISKYKYDALIIYFSVSDPLLNPTLLR